MITSLRGICCGDCLTLQLAGVPIQDRVTWTAVVQFAPPQKCCTDAADVCRPPKCLMVWRRNTAMQAPEHDISRADVAAHIPLYRALCSLKPVCRSTFALTDRLRRDLRGVEVILILHSTSSNESSSGSKPSLRASASVHKRPSRAREQLQCTGSSTQAERGCIGRMGCLLCSHVRLAAIPVDCARVQHAAACTGLR